MMMTSDQYEGLSKLEKWYHKNQRQFIDVAGSVGTGIWQLLQEFFDRQDIAVREVMYLSYDQKQVLELASRKYHAYYINGIIYKYNREVDLNSLPVINSHSTHLEVTWKKEVRKKVSPMYKIIVVFDSVLMNQNTINDLATFGLPIILLRDPILLPAPDTYTFLRDPNIILRELHPDLIRNPITYFANKVIRRERFEFGNYDTISIVHRKEMNIYNIKSAEIVITITNEMRNIINKLYRERILKQKGTVNIPGEKVIVMKDMYSHKLVNEDEKHIKVYLTRGMVGKLIKCNKHVESTKYVPVAFQPEFYYGQFEDMSMDRHYLNKINQPSRQIIPDDILYLDYAYALTPQLARVSHWDKITLIVDHDKDADDDLQMRLMYLALTRAKKGATIIL